MKKLALALLAIFSLSSCTIESSRYNDSKVIDGDPIIKKGGQRNGDKIYNSFIYDYDKENEEDECFECEILY